MQRATRRADRPPFAAFEGEDQCNHTVHSVAGVEDKFRTLSFRVRPTTLILSLAAITLVLTALVIALPVVAHLVGRDVGSATFRILDFRQEANIPTLYSTALLALAAGLLFLAGSGARSHDRGLAVRWYGLALIFVYLSVDEAAMLHEALNQVPLRFGSSLALPFLDRFPWVWFYGLAAAAIGLFYLPFLRRLPLRTALIFAISGCIYLGGALGLEAFGAYQIDSHSVSRESLAYILRGVAEEFCEMSGVLLFLWGLLDYLGQAGHRVTLSFESRAAQVQDAEAAGWWLNGRIEAPDRDAR